MTLNTRALRWIGAASIGIAVVAPSHATSSALARFGDLSISVVDLDPNDGIEAGYSRSSFSASLLTMAGPRGFVLPRTAFDQQFVTGRERQYHSRSDNGVASAEAWSGPGFDETLMFGQAPTGDTPDSRFETRVIVVDSLRIEPNSQLTFSAIASVGVHVDRIWRGSMCDRYTCARAHVGFGLSGGPPGTPYVPPYGLDLQADLAVHSVAFGERMTLTYATGAEPWDALMVAHVWATAYAPQPVPEPQTYALMLAGLGLLAGVARRRPR